MFQFCLAAPDQRCKKGLATACSSQRDAEKEVVLGKICEKHQAGWGKRGVTGWLERASRHAVAPSTSRQAYPDCGRADHLAMIGQE